MLEELGRLLTQAFMLNRREAERWAELIIGNQTGEAARQLVLAYIRGRQVGYTVHGSTLGMPRTIPTRVTRRWVEEGMRWAVDVQQRVLRTFDERGDVTRAFVQSYANGITTQATWTGNDEMFKDLAVASTVEFKRWVRAWPRTDHRDWHDILEDAKAIPVDDLFTLPGGPNAGSQVYGPRDWNRVGDPAEHMNCGHALAFETAPTAENTEDPRGSVVYDPRNQPRARASAASQNAAAQEPMRAQAPKPSRTAQAEEPPKPPVEERSDEWSPTKTPEAAEAFAQDSAYKEPVYHVTRKENVDSLQASGFDLQRKEFGRVWGDGVYLALDDETANMYQQNMSGPIDPRSGKRALPPSTGSNPYSERVQLRVNVRNPLEYVESAPWEVDREAILARLGPDAMPRAKELDRANRNLRLQALRDAPHAGTPTFRLTEAQLAERQAFFARSAASGGYNPDFSAFTEVLKENGYDSLIIRPAAAVGSNAYKEVGGAQLIVFDPSQVVIVRAAD